MAAPVKPIFIVGTGRCGSTMFHRILARHEQVGWLSTFNEVFPTQPWLSAASALYGAPLPVRLKHARGFPKPFEAYRFWEHYLPGFSRRDRPQTAADVPEAAVDPVRRIVSRVLAYQRRERLLAKVTGWSRIGLFDRIFPDALFIFLNREPRSVVSSWAQAGWLDVTSGLESPNWQWGAVPDEYRELWRELGGDAILSASVKIKLDLDDIRANLASVPDRWVELQYENLISSARPELRAITDFCELPWTPRWEREVERLTFYNPADKWKKYLSEADGARILDFFERARQAPTALGASASQA